MKILLILITIFCNSAEAADYQFDLARDTWQHGIVFKAGTRLTVDSFAKYPVKGTLASVYKARFNWAAGTEVTLNNKFEVVSGTSDTGNAVGGVAVKPATLMNMHPNGQVVYFTPATPFNLGKYKFTGDPVIVYDNGSIRNATASEPFEFVVPATGSTFSAAPGPLIFNPGGNASDIFTMGTINTATLAMDHLEKLQFLPQGATVSFSPVGAIAGISTTSTFVYNGISVPGGGHLQVHMNGIASLMPNQPVTISGKTYPAYKYIFLDTNGSIVGLPPA
jgi:hypothetical protein